jgi:hypothetical protein
VKFFCVCFVEQVVVPPSQNFRPKHLQQICDANLVAKINKVLQEASPRLKTSQAVVVPPRKKI